jgi:chromosome condensin MukBEF MukE localization factor
MTLTISPERRLVRIDVSGTLDDADYQRMVPELERLLEERSQLRLLVMLHDFSGWKPQALIEELRFDLRHRKDFDRIAIVGETAWEKWATAIAAPLFGGDMRFFTDEMPARHYLLHEDEPRLP